MDLYRVAFLRCKLSARAALAPPTLDILIFSAVVVEDEMAGYCAPLSSSIQSLITASFVFVEWSGPAMLMWCRRSWMKV